MHAVEAIQGLVSLVALLWLIYGPLQWICTDALRDVLFAERDKLFDAAKQGRIGFDDPIYRNIRARLNGHIRFSHEATLWRIAMLLASESKNNSRLEIESVQDMAAMIPDQMLKQEVIQSLNKVQQKTILMMALRAPVVFLLGISIAVCLPSTHGWTWERIRTRWRTVNNQANAIVQREGMFYGQ